MAPESNDVDPTMRDVVRCRRSGSSISTLILTGLLFASGPLVAQEIFSDGFETGDTTAWSQTVSPPRHLLISEIVTQTTAAEFIEIFNPGPLPVSLAGIYLADYADYYLITVGSGPPASSDFRVHFPNGAVIAAGAYVTVALGSATDFSGTYATPPDFDLDAQDANAPAMVGEFGASTGLTNGDEMLVLFEWDGVSELVGDHDYVVYGDTSDAMDKTGVTVGSSTYLDDTSAASQDFAQAPPDLSSLERCDDAEYSETPSGGNGVTGHDETSESLSTTFLVATPTPGSPSVCL